SGTIKAITAAASVPTAILLVKLIPKAMQLPSPSALRTANAALVNENAERKSAEAHLRDRTSQLEAANKELEAFSYSVSHDLRAPLRHVDGFAGLLRNNLDGKLEEDDRRYLANISNSIKQMGVLVDDLLMFSRRGRTEMHHTQVAM